MQTMTNTTTNKQQLKQISKHINLVDCDIASIDDLTHDQVQAILENLADHEGNLCLDHVAHTYSHDVLGWIGIEDIGDGLHVVVGVDHDQPHAPHIAIVRDVKRGVRHFLEMWDYCSQDFEDSRRNWYGQWGYIG